MADLRPSVVYHCAGAAHVGQSFNNIADTLAANVLGTHHVLDALEARASARACSSPARRSSIASRTAH